MSTTSQVTATIATGKTEPQKPSAPAAQSAAQSAAPAKPKNIYEGDARYAQFKIVNLRLLKPGTIQYDPNYPELVLSSSEPEGVPMPLTPFFSSRINQTLELVL